jgi:hypothetical protein
MTMVAGVDSPKWLRACQLLVGKDGDGNVTPATGLLIEGLRIVFDVTKTIYRTPNVATIKVYNLNNTSEGMILKEFNDVILQGGYVGGGEPMRLFFRGSIAFGSAYRDDTSRICEINARDGDKDFQGALVNFTLAAGHTDEDAIRKVLESFRATMLGHVHGKNLRSKHGRARTFSGNARDVLDRIAGNNDAEWSIQNGLLTMVPVDSTLPTEAFELSSETGLLGTPEANDKGITMKVMFDPRIIPGSKVWLKNNEVKTKHLNAAITGQKRKLHGPNVPSRKDPDGIYKVYAVHAVGDTRGDDWHAELKCVALDSPIPSSKGMPQSSAPDEDVMP